MESGLISDGRLPPTRPSMMDLVEGLKNQQKEEATHRDSLFSLQLFKEQNTEIIEGQQRILGKFRSQPRRSESGYSKVFLSHKFKFLKIFFKKEINVYSKTA